MGYPEAMIELELACQAVVSYTISWDTIASRKSQAAETTARGNAGNKIIDVTNPPRRIDTQRLNSRVEVSR
jgi:hypothetical protein